MKENSNTKELVDLVKTGQLDSAFSLYQSSNRSFSLTKYISLRLLCAWLSVFVSFFISRRRPKLDLRDDAVDLNVEFVIFWKCPDVIGRKLLVKIAGYYFFSRKLPARALAWYGHWLVFQGRYKAAGIIFKFILSRVIKDSRLHGEVLSLSGNYFYSRDKLEESVRNHKKADTILKLNNDKFFQMFNLGTSAKTYTELGCLDQFTTNVLAGFDHLDPREPDERYGMRVLIYCAYLNFINGNVENGKQFYVSAEKCYLKSGSSLDKAIYSAYKAVILIFFRDLDGARKTIAEATKHIKQFGKYESHEKLILITRQYLYQGNSSHKIIENLLGVDMAVKRSELESWYSHFFRTILPVLENFQNEELGKLVVPLERVTNSSVHVVLKSEIVRVEDIKEASFQVLDSQDGTTSFLVEFFHQNKMYDLKVTTSYKRWRNPEIFESIRSTLCLLQSLSKQEQLRSITMAQSQKLKEGELARRIAHDIKSPLAALQVALGSLGSQMDLSIIKASTHKIENIVHGLSKKSGYGDSKEVNKVLVRSLIDSIISSKRIEYQGGRFDIDLEYINDSSSKYLEVNELEMSRTLSNIINNSVESYKSGGRVKVLVDVTRGNLKLCIQDSGCGIESANLEKIFEKDISFKKGGSGLGLFYARMFLEANGGQITADSRPGKGTTVALTYPLAAPPSWVKTTLFVDGYKRIVIVDDFLPNIEMMKRTVEAACPGKEIISFSSLTDLTFFLDNNDHESTFFIIDFDFDNDSRSGLEIILDRTLRQRSILATHHFEDEDLIKACVQHEVTVVPKIIFNELRFINEKPHIIIADDEKYFLKAIKGKLKDNFNVLTFDTPADLLPLISNIKGEPFFFIDRNYENSDIRGETIFSELEAAGKINLYNISEESTFFSSNALKIRKTEIEHMFL